MEPHVAGHRLAVAVERKPDKMPLAVEHGAARIAPRNVVVGQEIDIERIVLAPASPVPFGDQPPHTVVDAVFVFIGVVLLHIPRDRRTRIVMHAVRRVQGLHATVGQAHGRVSVGILRQPFRSTEIVKHVGIAALASPDTRTAALLGLVHTARKTLYCDRFGKRNHGVAAYFGNRPVLREIGVVTRRIAAKRGIERRTRHAVGIASRLVVHRLQLRTPHLARHVGREVHYHPRQQVAVGRGIVVTAQAAAPGHDAPGILRIHDQRVLLQPFELAQVRRHAVGHEQRLAGAEPCLAEIIEVALGALPRLITARELFEQRPVLGLAGRIGLDPALQAFLLGLTDRHDIEAAQAFVLPLGVVGVVAQAEIGIRILHAHPRIAFHMAFENIHPVMAVGHDDRVADTLFLSHRERRRIAVRTPRESDHHRKIAVMHAARGDLQHAAGFERHIVGGIGRRAPLPVGINAVKREIALVLGPAPVVVIAAEGTDRRRRRTDQPHILVDVVVEHQVHFTAPHRVARHLALRFPAVTSFQLGIEAARGHHAPFPGGFHLLL